MHRTLRFVVGWVAAATAAVGLSWTVIRDAVDPGWLGRSVPGGTAPSHPGVIGAPTQAVGSRDPALLARGSSSRHPSGTPDGTPGGTGDRTGPAAASGPTPRASRGPASPGTAVAPAPTGPTGRTGTTGTTGTSAGATPSATSSGVPARSTAATSTAATSTGAASTGASQTSAGATGVRSYLVTGGRVVLRLAADSAQLVSATPDDGYRVQSWETAGWLRVDFSRDGTTASSVIATWNGTPPTVTTVRY